MIISLFTGQQNASDRSLIKVKKLQQSVVSDGDALGEVQVYQLRTAQVIFRVLDLHCQEVMLNKTLQGFHSNDDLSTCLDLLCCQVGDECEASMFQNLKLVCDFKGTYTLTDRQTDRQTAVRHKLLISSSQSVRLPSEDSKTYTSPFITSCNGPVGSLIGDCGVFWTRPGTAVTTAQRV